MTSASSPSAFVIIEPMLVSRFGGGGFGGGGIGLGDGLGGGGPGSGGGDGLQGGGGLGEVNANLPHH